MYCSSCGSAVPAGLSYCNRCGVDLRANDPEVGRRSGLSPDALVRSIVVVTIFGLFAVMMLMAVMRVFLEANLGLISGFATAAFLLILLVDALFAGLLLSSRRGQKKSSDLVELKAQLTRELGAAQTHSLREPALSVTDHTTRTLEPVGKRD